jgi:hypothetical protein
MKILKTVAWQWSFFMFARHGRALMGESPLTCPGSGKCTVEQQGCPS